MLKRFYPSERAASVFEIDYDKLYAKGYRAVIFDLDNTLVHHGDDSTPEVDELIRSIQARGFKVLLLTDNDQPRVERFLKNITCLYVCDAEKPKRKGYKRALKLLDVSKDQVICVGDQIFTDIRGANKMGIDSILVNFILLPGETKIGKKRYVEKAILALYEKNARLSHTLGDVLIER